MARDQFSIKFEEGSGSFLLSGYGVVYLGSLFLKFECFIFRKDLWKQFFVASAFKRRGDIF